MRVLVAYGPAHGATADVAGLLAFVLRVEGFDAHARPAAEIGELGEADAVVVGGLVCTGRWNADARRFVRRHRTALTTRPVWLFSCGSSRECGPGTSLATQVQVLMRRIHARGHVGLDDRLPAIASRLGPAELTHHDHQDWLDPQQLARFARGIADELRREQPQPL